MPANGRSCGKCDYWVDLVLLPNTSDKNFTAHGICCLNNQPVDKTQYEWCGQYKPDSHRKEKKTGCVKESYGKFVKMLPAEYDKLCDLYGNKQVNDIILRMDAYCNKGHSYKDYYLAVSNWIKKENSKPQGAYF